MVIIPSGLIRFHQILPQSGGYLEQGYGKAHRAHSTLAGGARRYADGDGHFLDVSGKASGRWLLRLQAGGRRREIGTGSLKSVSLADARDAAYMMRNKIAQGIDTVAERKREREAIPTFCKVTRCALPLIGRQVPHRGGRTRRRAIDNFARSSELLAALGLGVREAACRGPMPLLLPN